MAKTKTKKKAAKKKTATTKPKTATELVLDKYGAGAIQSLTGGAVERVPAISTGSIGLDRATGINGFPRGRIVEIYGPESSGKTTLAIHAIAEC